MSIENKAVNTLRVMSVEVINNANSGHSGIALGAAAIMYAMYKSMRVDNKNPNWFNRDRFVFSAGHGSALMYSAMHMFGFPIPRDELKTFRQMGARLHGHPEVLPELGIDASTGPLGQGVAMAVGLALAEQKLGKTYNRDKHEIIDHYTYCIAGDGCIMEGVAIEACSLAGKWKLNKLIMLYDANDVTLDGPLCDSDSEDVAMRFTANGWNVIVCKNANEPTSIEQAIQMAKQSVDKPTLIICKTNIGYGASAEGTHKAHGQVLSKDEIVELRQKWALVSENFDVDADVEEHFVELAKEKTGHHDKWMKDFGNYKKKFKREGLELEQFFSGVKGKFNIVADDKRIAMRDAGQVMLKQAAGTSPRVWGGSADVASTTKAFVGNDISFGIREHGMAAICNGLALHGFMSYCSTFLSFSDYLRPSLRLSALMGVPVHYMFTHDGFGNPPDGPTHQANEHIASLRLVPSLHVFRPCNAYEVAATYKYIYENEIPAVTILSRGGEFKHEINIKNVDIEKGAYVIYQSKNAPKVTMLATGAEVGLAMDSVKMLEDQGIDVRVVSMPCESLFAKQEKEYKDSVIALNVPVVAVEMGRGDMWYKYVGRDGAILSFNEFGHSATEGDMKKHTGFTVENLVNIVSSVVKK